MGFTLDLSDVEPQEGFDTLKPGKYRLKVEGFEKKTSKNHNKYVAATFKVDAGQKGAGMKLFENFAIENEVGRQRLRTLAVRAGITKPKFDVMKLVGKTVLCKVGIEKDEEYGDKNKIIQFLEEKEDDDSTEETETSSSGSGNATPEDIDDEEIPW
jgi:hypothetical protein